MNWDKFKEKLDRIEEECPGALQAFINEFISLKELSMAIIEMILYDRVKYGTISYAISKDKKYLQDVTDATHLSTLLEQFKEGL